MGNNKGYVESGKHCKKCVYNIYKKGNLCSTYPCGMSVCKPLLENEKNMDIEDEKIKYNNVGVYDYIEGVKNGYYSISNLFKNIWLVIEENIYNLKLNYISCQQLNLLNACIWRRLPYEKLKLLPLV